MTVCTLRGTGGEEGEGVKFQKKQLKLSDPGLCTILWPVVLPVTFQGSTYVDAGNPPT